MTSAESTLADRIDALLPQTQCTQCGYRGCRPYAAAIAAGAAEINQCPPGGAATIAQLALLLGREPLPLNPVNGIEKPLAIAFIEEQHCIGCTLCIAACPVDAIVGAPKRMHTVIAELCSGCALCVAPCPVDCIPMRPAPFAWTDARAVDAKLRYEARNARMMRENADSEVRIVANSNLESASLKQERSANASVEEIVRRKKAIIDAAIARSRERLANRQ